MREKKKHCFVIMPFGGYFDQYYSEIYKPAIEANDLVAIRADSLFRPSTIISDIWEFTNSSEIMLADLTGTNPNVMYELGLAHAIAKPTVLISETIDSVPFDLRSLRVLTYNKNEPDWNEKLKTKIMQSIAETINSPADAVMPTFMKVKPNIPEITEFSNDLIEIKQMLNKAISGSLNAQTKEHKSKTRILNEDEFHEAVRQARKLYFDEGLEVSDIKHYIAEHYSIDPLTADDIFKRVRI